MSHETLRDAGNVCPACMTGRCQNCAELAGHDCECHHFSYTGRSSMPADHYCAWCGRYGHTLPECPDHEDTPDGPHDRAEDHIDEHGYGRRR